MGRWGGKEVGRWGDGEMESWERWGVGKVGRWEGGRGVGEAWRGEEGRGAQVLHTYIQTYWHIDPLTKQVVEELSLQKSKNYKLLAFSGKAPYVFLKRFHVDL